MSWISKTAAAVALGFAMSATAGTIVVKASGPSAASYPPGRPVTGTTINLKRGDTLVLLDGRGTRTISGPGVHSVSGSAAAATGGPSALGALLRSSGTRQVRTGAVRSAGAGEARSPNLWYIDTARAGTVCVNGPAALWRADVTAASSIVVTRLSDGRSATVAFNAGQSVRALPAELGNEGRYRLSTADRTRSVEVNLKPIATSGEVDAVAGALIQQGCQRQLDLLLAAATPTS